MREEMYVTFKALLDWLNTQLKDRFINLSQLHKQFGFLLDIENLNELNKDTVEKCKVDTAMYEGNFDGTELGREITDCQIFVKPKIPTELFNFTMSYGDYVFPNVQIALRRLLAVAVSVASWKHSFIKLKFMEKHNGSGRPKQFGFIQHLKGKIWAYKCGWFY